MPTRRKAEGADYDASHIQVLKGLEAVRKRPGMYIGGTGSDGLSHLLWELVDNAVDEAAGGFATKIDVTFHRDRSIEVTDDGRGIPIDVKDKGRTALEVVFTELHAGGKFGSGAYAASGGLHGVGASVVNALSTKLVAEVDRDGATWRLGFSERLPGRFETDGSFTPTSTLEKVKGVRRGTTGTRVRFWPDTEVFDPDATIEYASVRERLARMCFLVPGLKIRLTDKRPGASGETEEFVSKGGLADFVDYLSVGENLTEVVRFSGLGTFTEKVAQGGAMTEIERECTVEVALRWVKGYEPVVVSFVNTIPTTEGGTHVAGFERAMTRVVNDVLLNDLRKLAKLAKEGKGNATKEDIQEGLVAALKVTLPEPQFRGQTKEELGTPGVQSIVYEVVKRDFTNWIGGDGKKTHVNAVRDKVANAVINRVTSKQALETKRKAANLGATGMPDKLADCRVHGLDSELIIVEGDSAAGPAKQGRNSETQAVLPLRGKIVNAGKATMKQVLDNAEAQAIFTAIGAGQGKDFDLDLARYGRIVILCDADVDGSHIRCLLLTLFHRYMRPMLDAGRIFAAQPPLYTTKVGGETYRAWSDAERDRIVAELTKGNRKAESIQWSRFKGLGEMDVAELAETALDSGSRILKRMTVDDAEAAARAADLFEVLMGNDVNRRRDFLLANSRFVDQDALDV
ncbi:DNA gyrase/topoisomerase IV subunit B [Actinomarinicola tropica]|uniref:DNA topoisomerase (ATP-hydrolyzing) n=1 Tax=Actinomarinicola tropica TaxID=2789776 RepID=A0A5Q2RKX2_9ACTN|nr:DNA topoisomerase IV subunit B [Actinomarinicola tropica]QGG96134.1 DNA topoisomerase IV subunit B [Actinomarinicola tropica]